MPLNRPPQPVFEILANDRRTGEWLFTNSDDEPIKSIKKGFSAARKRAAIEDLRSYDLRYTFATRLLERGVHHFVISALLGHSTPIPGFGAPSRMTPGYAHAIWDTDGDGRCNARTALTAQADQLRGVWKCPGHGPVKEG